MLYNDNTKVINTELVDEMENSMLNYAMSVIVSRALPDVRDGLKPVHRRISIPCTRTDSLPISRTESAPLP